MTELDHKPPKIFLWILRRLTVYEELFAISWDYEIEYARICKKSSFVWASVWLLWNTIQTVIYYSLFIIKWSIIMFKNYLKTTWRVLRRNKGFSFINITGLVVGMACSLTIALYIHHELNFDRFHNDSHRIFRVCSLRPVECFRH